MFSVSSNATENCSGPMAPTGYWCSRGALDPPGILFTQEATEGASLHCSALLGSWCSGKLPAVVSSSCQQPHRAPSCYLSEHLGFKEGMLDTAAVVVHIFHCSSFIAAQLTADSYSVISDSEVERWPDRAGGNGWTTAQVLWVRSRSTGFWKGCYDLWEVTQS